MPDRILSGEFVPAGDKGAVLLGEKWQYRREMVTPSRYALST